MDSTQPTLVTKITHLVWDDDENESLCGLDVSDYIWENSLFPWDVTTPWDCPTCTEVKSFVSIFNHFNTTYDTKTSIAATLQSMKNWNEVLNGEVMV